MTLRRDPPGPRPESGGDAVVCRRAGVAVVPRVATPPRRGRIAFDGDLAAFDAPTRDLHGRPEHGQSSRAGVNCRFPGALTVSQVGTRRRSRRTASATIGVITRTNSGGLHVLRWAYGDHPGIQAAIQAGTIAGDHPSSNDNTGYNLRSPLRQCSTLAVVTSARCVCYPTDATSSRCSRSRHRYVVRPPSLCGMRRRDIGDEL